MQRFKETAEKDPGAYGRKTDPEATFMRMKEDHMLNGQLKPGYNVNVATVSEYMVGTYVSQDRTDTRTTIPFMKELHILTALAPMGQIYFF